ncbi:uncharacterized protein LOC131937406 [Physella acuta]|uniref:uncharacterized protein LOC131937406 n=1 Tax=Physella acuta TaxID=109671 RepID=UPI0027DE0AD8|nr:uncharacterized protein LOC131937406 [Physella acuta]
MLSTSTKTPTMTPTFARTVLLTTLTACILCVGQATRYPLSYTLDAYCGTTIRVSGDVLIRLSYSTYLPADRTCSITLLPSSGDGLVASVDTYSLNYLYSTSQCLYEAIQLGSADVPQIWGPYGYCKSYRPTAKYSLGRYGTYSYKTGKYSFIETGDIKLLVTETFSRNATGYCASGQFDCERQNICISRSLTCNGYDDCGNDLDETDGCSLPPGIIGGIAAGIFVFIVLVIVISFFIRRQRYRAVYVQYQ